VARKAGSRAERTAAITLLEDRLLTLIAMSRSGVRMAASAVHPDLAPVGLLLLRRIQRDGPMTPGVAAEKLHVDKSVISRQTRQLEDIGLVKVTVDRADRRNRVVALTSAAVKRLDAAAPSGLEQWADMVADWEIADLNRAVELAGKLVERGKEIQG
jgi:DNA-binding MarR family transcriptional regulator